MKKRGGGSTSIYPSIHFIPLRGLDFSGETEVIRLHVIPQMLQKKALQTASAIFTHKILELNFLFALQVCDSCNSVFMVQRGRRPAPVFEVTLKKLLAHLVYFLPPHSSSSRLNSITCFPSNSRKQELNSMFGGKCL